MERIEVKAQVTVDDAGTVEGLAWPFGTADLVGDVIEPGAFAKAITPLPMLDTHDPSKIIGVWDQISETSEGLQVKGRLLIDDVARAREVRSFIKSGVMRGLSVGFRGAKSAPRQPRGRTITDLELVEISVCRSGVNPGAGITHAKGGDMPDPVETPDLTALSRARLIEEADRTFRQVAGQQLKRAEGDYSPDPKGERFPPVETQSSALASTEDSLSIRALFKLWERDHLANGKSPRTVGDFLQKIESLIDYLGHDQAQRVTPENIADWCDHLRHEKGLAARTVSQKYLTVIKVIFGVAVEKRKLKENPAKENKVRFVKPQRTRSKGFTDAEAKTILTAALADPDLLGRRTIENKRAIR